MTTENAFELSEEDVVLVLVQMGRSATADVLADVMARLDRGAIDDAASQGTTMDERNDLAHEEIARQIRRMDS